MRSLGVHRAYVLDDQDPFQTPLAQIVASEAKQAGIAIAAHDSIPVTRGADFTGVVEKIVESGAQAVFLAGGPGEGTVALWKRLHAANPRLLLLGPSTLLDESFTSAIGPAGDNTYLTTPVLAARLYPRSAQRVLSEYGRTFGAEAGPYALYGYEAMSAVLGAIRGAGSRGNERQAVIERFFAASRPDSVLGPYSIGPDGETTLSRYGVDRVVNGRPVFFRMISVR
jgi:branched-chain amino acid transport system substrate-binding protein